MKKVFLLGAVCLGIGFTSCKTNCPAYGATEPAVKHKTSITASTTPAPIAQKATSKV